MPRGKFSDLFALEGGQNSPRSEPLLKGFDVDLGRLAEHQNVGVRRHERHPLGARRLEGTRVHRLAKSGRSPEEITFVDLFFDVVRKVLRIVSITEKAALDMPIFAGIAPILPWEIVLIYW